MVSKPDPPEGGSGERDPYMLDRRLARRQIAVAAMQGLLAADTEMDMDRVSISKEAYRQADAMLLVEEMSFDELYDSEENE